MEIIYEGKLERVFAEGEDVWYENEIDGTKVKMGSKSELIEMMFGRWRQQENASDGLKKCKKTANVEINGEVHMLSSSGWFADQLSVSPPLKVSRLADVPSLGCDEFSSTIRVEEVAIDCLHYDIDYNLYQMVIMRYRVELDNKISAIKDYLGIIGSCYFCDTYLTVDNVRSFENRRGDISRCCDECFADTERVCDVCGEHYHYDSTAVHCNGVRYESLCSRCSSNIINDTMDTPEICDWCGYTYDWEETHSSYCPRCYDAHHWTCEEQRYDYVPPTRFTHSSSDVTDVEREGVRYVGCELEMEGGDCDSYRYALWSKLRKDGCDKHVYFMHDGSLRDGTETATVPISLDYALHGYPFDTIHRVASNNRMKSHQTSTCGFHIHVNRASIPDFELTMAKVLLTFDKFYDKLLTFARRRAKDRPEHWCAKPNADIQKSDTPSVLRDKLCVARDHYRAVNLLPRNTVEFRLWKGTHNPDTIRATIDFLSTLIDVCHETELEVLYDWTWEQFIAKVAPKCQLEATRDYIKSRGLM